MFTFFRSLNTFSFSMISKKSKNSSMYFAYVFLFTEGDILDSRSWSDGESVRR